MKVYIYCVFDENEIPIYIGKTKNSLIKRESQHQKRLKQKVNIFELACKIKKNSYISFESILAQNNIINQWYDEIILASDRKLSMKNKYGKFVYKKLPQRILANRLGIIKKDEYFIAIPERALCDKIYKDGLIYFDDLTSIDNELILNISQIYNKRVVADVKKLLNIK